MRTLLKAPTKRYMPMELRRERTTRLLKPLREGGSLPLLVEASDGFKYALKLKGGGHGPKALIAELIGGEVARALGLKTPELVLLDVTEHFGRTEADYDVQNLLKNSRGLNIGAHFLSGALTLDPYANPVGPDLASKIVWLDAYLTNIDRTMRNTNMLLWYGETWLIDHGASLLFQDSWDDPEKAALSPFKYIKDHALLRKATKLELADQELKKLLTSELIDSIVSLIPDEWLHWPGYDEAPAELRLAYSTFLKTRLDNSKIFVDNAIDLRRNFV